MSIVSSAFESSTARRIIPAWLCLVCALVASAAGCRTGRDNQIDILERELRTQEDYIYELEDYVCQYSEKLRECRCSQPLVVTKSTPTKSVMKKSKPAAPRIEPGDTLRLDEEPFDALPAPSRPANRSLRRSNPPKTAPVQKSAPEDLEVPDLEIGAPVGLLENDPRVQPADYMSALPPVDDSQSVTEDEQVEAAEYEALLQEEAARMPEQVVVTHLIRDESGDASSSRLLAVVEARDANDEPVEVNGEVSLMVMTADGQKPVRLKRWDFTAADAASAWQSSHLGDGLHLELPLEETELPDAPLELWVRVVVADGSKLLTQLPFERELLATLDSVSGAGETQLVRQDAEVPSHEVEGRLLSAEEPVDHESDTQAQWKPSLVRSDSTATSSAVTTVKSGGWTAQPPGGRFPQLQPVAAAEPSVKQPLWTAGRVEPVSSTPTQRGSQPHWSPFR